MSGIYVYPHGVLWRGTPGEPYIQWKHIDGPLLHCSDGSLHWLTWRERLALYFGRTTIYLLERKYSAHADLAMALRRMKSGKDKP